MPANITLDAQKHTVLLEFPEACTWEDFHQSVRQMHELVRSVDYPVDVIIHQTAPLPPGNPIPQFRAAFNQQPVNVRQVVIVNASPDASIMVNFMQQIAGILGKLFPSKNKVAVVRTMAEADALLQR